MNQNDSINGSPSEAPLPGWNWLTELRVWNHGEILSASRDETIREAKLAQPAPWFAGWVAACFRKRSQ